MRIRGFIFSLDAFVAFILTMITISILVFTIGTPKPFYPSLSQAHQLAYDSLQVLSTTPGTGQTYLEQIVAAGPYNQNTVNIMTNIIGGNTANPAVRSVIPIGFGYRLETYDFNDGNWTVLYDSITVPASGRLGKNYTKLQASASTFDSVYTVARAPGESPFCYSSCSGYQPDGSHLPSLACNVTPCDSPYSNFNPGANTVKIIRMIVYT